MQERVSVWYWVGVSNFHVPTWEKYFMSRRAIKYPDTPCFCERNNRNLEWELRRKRHKASWTPLPWCQSPDVGLRHKGCFIWQLCYVMALGFAFIWQKWFAEQRTLCNQNRSLLLFQKHLSFPSSFLRKQLQQHGTKLTHNSVRVRLMLKNHNT